MVRTVDNHGIGALYATFNIHKTGDDYDLDETNLGDAVTLSSSNEIDLGSCGDQLLGRLEHVAGGLATVQIRGVIRFALSDLSIPEIGNGVVVDGMGRVYQAPAIPDGYGVEAGGSIARGSTIAVDGRSECDVLL